MAASITYTAQTTANAQNAGNAQLRGVLCPGAGAAASPAAAPPAAPGRTLIQLDPWTASYSSELTIQSACLWPPVPPPLAPAEGTHTHVCVRYAARDEHSKGSAGLDGQGKGTHLETRIYIP